jgi:hypothetical protein
MKIHLTLIAVALFAFGLIGCSKQPQSKAVTALKSYDLGVVDVSDGIQTTKDLGDGRVCVITPALQKDGSMILNMTLEESGKVLEKFRTQFDKHTSGFTMSVGHFSIAMNPRIKT